MSMSTFFVLMSKDGTRVERVAPSTSADEAHRFFTVGWAPTPGEIYAARMSESAAVIVRNLVNEGKSEIANRTLKLYAHSLTKVGDVT
jgi:hypothetical protein